MIGQAVPLFESGNLLTKEMLLSLKHFSIDYSELLYEGYGDGILTGCKISRKDNTLVLNPGIIIFKGKLYLIRMPFFEVYDSSNKVSYFKIRFNDEIKTSDFLYREIEMVIEKEPADPIKEIELCRYKLQKGFLLRNDYKDFFDRNTEFDTINTIYSPFASYGESSISPEILVHFANSIRTAESKEPLDLFFCTNIYQANGRTMNKEAIITYINAKCEMKIEKYANEDLFFYLSTILKETSSNRNRENSKYQGDRMVLLD